MSEFDGTLDLTGANPDEVGFPAVPSGAYEAHVGKAEWRQTSNPDGTKALPDGTPYLAVGIRINTDVEERDGQRVAGQYAGWTNLYVPPADYDVQKAQQMKNRMANFLRAIGEDFTKKNFKMPPVDEIIGRELTVIVRRKPDKNDRNTLINEIEGFKVAGSSQESDTPAGMLR